MNYENTTIGGKFFKYITIALLTLAIALVLGVLLLSKDLSAWINGTHQININRINLAQKTLGDFAVYRIYEGDIIEMAIKEKDISHTEKAEQRFEKYKAYYVGLRNAAHQALISDLAAGQLYFGSRFSKTSNDFISWDKNFQLMAIDQLSTIKNHGDGQLEKWQEIIIQELKKEVKS